MDDRDLSFSKSEDEQSEMSNHDYEHEMKPVSALLTWPARTGDDTRMGERGRSVSQPSLSISERDGLRLRLNHLSPRFADFVRKQKMVITDKSNLYPLIRCVHCLKHRHMILIRRSSPTRTRRTRAVPRSSNSWPCIRRRTTCRHRRRRRQRRQRQLPRPSRFNTRTSPSMKQIRAARISKVQSKVIITKRTMIITSVDKRSEAFFPKQQRH